MNIEVVIIFLLIFTAFILLLFDKELNYLKNYQIVVATAAIIVGGHYSYVELIEKKADKEKLPPALSLKCALTKVGQNDTCNWLKASVNIENKSSRRIYILSTTYRLSCFNTPLQKESDKWSNDSLILDEKDHFNYSDSYNYEEEDTVVFQFTSDNQNWYDENEEENTERIIKVPSGYEAARLKITELKSNYSLSEIPELRLAKYVKNKIFGERLVLNDSNMESMEDNENKIAELKNKYGMWYSEVITETLLK